MKNPYSFLFVFAIIIFTTNYGHTQQSVTAAGGDATGTGGSSSYSIGQVVYTTITGSEASLAQGVQQPYEISTTSGIDVPGIELSISAYPNPAKDHLILKVDQYNELSYQLFDIGGNILLTNKLTENITTIQFPVQLPGIFILKVLKENKDIKTFKLIKN